MELLDFSDVRIPNTQHGAGTRNFVAEATESDAAIGTVSSAVLCLTCEYELAS